MKSMQRRIMAVALFTASVLVFSLRAAESLPVETTAPAPVAAVSSGLTMSALAYADYYWVSAHHLGQYQNSNGMQFRRVWLTGDKDLGNNFSGRLRFELAGGDFASASASAWAAPVVKDLWLKWAYAEKQAASLGVIEGSALGFVEKNWGLRSVEKSPLDLQAWEPTREQGLSLAGELGDSAYNLVFSNGANTANQGNDNGKKLQLALTQKLPASLSLTLFGDVKAGADGTFVQPATASGSSYLYTAQAFLGYKSDALRVGLLYARQVAVRPTFGDETFRELVSAHLVAKVWGKASAFARVDHMLWNSLDKGGETYLQLARLRSTFSVVGLDYPVTKGLNIQPNVEWVNYQSDLSEGARGIGNATADCIPRLTVAYQF